MRILPLCEAFPEMSPAERLEKIHREVTALDPEDEICAVGGVVYPEDGEQWTHARSKTS